jgi:pimeloyl-ACP methyl ester carboxylesterase
MATVEINGFTMFYEVRGDGRPLLLLHGGMGIGADWRHVFPTDPPGHQVLVPDLRGHGQSTTPPGIFSFRDCARDVLSLLDHLALPRVRAIGLSLGAKTLLHVATAQPDRVEAMVLVSATPYFPDTLRAAAARFTPEAFAELPAAELAALRARHVNGDGQIRALYDMTRSFATSEGDMAFTPALLSRIAARTLVVHGDRDPLYPVELALELYRGIPRASLWVVPNGGHGPIFGAPAPAFSTAALAFLEAPAET